MSRRTRSCGHGASLPITAVSLQGQLRGSAPGERPTHACVRRRILRARGRFESSAVLAAWLRRPTDERHRRRVPAGHVVGADRVARLASTRGTRTRAMALTTAAAQLALAIGGARRSTRPHARGASRKPAALVAATCVVVAWIGLDRLHVVTFGDASEPGATRDALRGAAIARRRGSTESSSRPSWLRHRHGGHASPRSARGAHVPSAAPAWPGRPGCALRAVARRRPACRRGLGTNNDALGASLPWGRDVDASDPANASDRLREPVRRRRRGADVRASPAAIARRHARRAALGAKSAERRHRAPRVDALRHAPRRRDAEHLRLSKSCLSPTHHYSTSNNTGSSMFGLLTGLPVSYYALARREQGQAASLPDPEEARLLALCLLQLVPGDVRRPLRSVLQGGRRPRRRGDATPSPTARTPR